jgi:sugar diacid utilization regulator
MTANQLQQAKVQLFDAYIRDASLQELIDLAGSLMGNPIVVVDGGYRILAHTARDEIDDAFWQKYISQGFCTYEYIALVNTLDSVKEGRKYAAAYRVYCQLSNNYKLVCRLFGGKTPLGDIILFESCRNFTPEDYILLEDIARMISQKLGSSKSYHSAREVIGEDFLYDLLEERCSSMQEMEARAKHAGISRMSAPHLLVFDLSQYRPDIDSERLKRQLQHNWDLTPSLMYNSDSVVAVCDDARLRPLFSEIDFFCRTHGLYLGVSRKIKTPLKLRIHFQDARRVIEAGRLAYPDRHSWRYHEVAFFLELPALDREEAHERFCYPEMERLMVYDRKLRTDLYHTFYTYMLLGRSVQKTAAELYIHRNTVRYRINQIAQVANIDFEDINHLEELFLACRILRYLLHREADAFRSAAINEGII